MGLTKRRAGASAAVRRWGSFPTTADVGIWARADRPDALLEALGLGLFALMTDLRKVRSTEQRVVQASGSDPESLVVAWLGQLLLLQQTEGWIARELDVRLVGTPPTALIATAHGEPFDARRHSSRAEVKAVTYHRMRLDLVRGRARVIVDI
ncbi:MAG TPA: archease [Thermoplasmata archaeon]|nr:archease [Thermoplasmata archaeon]